MLADDGVAVIETPYVRDLVERTEFDTVYHEHLFYYSLTALDRLFARNGLRIVDVERLEIHGGSLRVFAVRADSREEARPAVGALLDEEERLGIADAGYFEDFAARVETLRGELWELLRDLKGQGHRIAAYGAAAKGATLLNTFGIGADVLDFVADRSEHKQGLYMPGVRLPIVSAASTCSRRCPTRCFCSRGTSPTRSSSSRPSTAGGADVSSFLPQPQLV